MGDEEALRRLNRAFRALCACNGQMVRATSEREVLDGICQTLVHEGGYRMAWVGFVDPESGLVRPVSAAGAPEDTSYLAKISISARDDALGRGPTGTALRTGVTSINRDSETNPDFAPWRSVSLEHGFRSSIALPLLDRGQTFGALTVYAAQVDAFDADERALLEQFAADVAFGVLALRTREALAHARQQLEEERTARARFAILDQAPNAFLALDHDYRVLYANATGARLMGVTVEELLGERLDARFPAVVETPFWAAYQRAMNARELVALEGHYPPSQRWYDVRAYPIEDGIAVHFTDVSERKRLELGLRESEERFRELAGAVDEVFWLRDPATNELLYVSPAFERVFGHPREALATGTTWLELLHPEDRARIVGTLHRQARGDWEETYRAVRPDGSIRWVRSRAFPVRAADGSLRRIAGIAVDITERMRLEEQYRQAQKMDAIGRLAGGIAHDFNNVLSVILSYADLALEDATPGTPLAEDLGSIARAGHRAAELTAQLLAFSRQQHLEPRVVDVGECLKRLEGMLRRVLGEDIELLTRCEKDLGAVRVDAGQLEQALLNLAINARDAMPNGGELEIKARNVDVTDDGARPPGSPAGPCVQIEVRDTGTGMDEATRARIFEPFFTTKGPGKGTGLGLATVQGIVQQCGGSIDVRSELGRGTAFAILLPRSREVPTSDPPVDAEIPELRGDETVLLVEDEDAVREAARGILVRNGYRVLAASSPEEALAIVGARGSELDAIVSDMVMPHMSGADLLERVANDLPDLALVLMSGHTAEKTFEGRGRAAGATFLQKPVTPAKLLTALRRALR